MRLQLGDFLPLSVQCYNSSGVEAAPTAAPQYTIYDASDNVVSGADDVAMPIQAKGERVGFFYADVLLGSTFSAGRYNYRIAWAVSGSSFSKVGSFEVVAGGNAQGGVIGLEFLKSPHANHVVQMTEDGTVEFRKGPYL